MCQHNLNLIDSTIKLSDKRFGIYPNILTGNCTVCHKIYKFIKLDNGNYKEVKKGVKLI